MRIIFKLQIFRKCFGTARGLGTSYFENSCQSSTKNQNTKINDFCDLGQTEWTSVSSATQGMVRSGYSKTINVNLVVCLPFSPPKVLNNLACTIFQIAFPVIIQDSLHFCKASLLLSLKNEGITWELVRITNGKSPHLLNEKLQFNKIPGSVCAYQFNKRLSILIPTSAPEVLNLYCSLKPPWEFLKILKPRPVKSESLERGQGLLLTFPCNCQQIIYYSLSQTALRCYFI